MDFLDNIFCFIMAGFGLEIGSACSGSRTFIDCQITAAVNYLLSWRLAWRWIWRMHAVAALIGLSANIVRVIILMGWIKKGLPNYEISHDIVGICIVGLAIVCVAMYQPWRSKA